MKSVTENYLRGNYSRYFADFPPGECPMDYEKWREWFLYTFNCEVVPPVMSFRASEVRKEGA
jgi:hypothetical protein